MLILQVLLLLQQLLQLRALLLRALQQARKRIVARKHGCLPVHGAAVASAANISAKVLILPATSPYSPRLNLALVVAVGLSLRCWPGGCGDTKTTGCQAGLAGENLEQELCLIFSFHLLLYCLVADEEDNDKMRVLIPAGAEQRTR